MSSQTQPINGNQAYTHLANVAANVPHANITELTSNSIDANMTKSNFGCTINGVDGTTSPPTIFAGKRLHYVVGNIPTSTPGAATWFNLQPGQPSTNTVANLLTVPNGALIVGAFLQDSANTYAGGNTDVGTELATGSAPGGSNNIFNTALQATIRAGATVGQTAPTAIGSAGAATRSYLAVPATGTYGVSITPTDAAVSSSVTLTIYYLL